jgi:hypothetical protein
MNCERYGEWIGDLIDGALDPVNQAELDAHLRGCAACRELLDDLGEIRAAAASLDRRTPPDELWQAITSKIEASTPTRRSLAFSYGPLAAAAALVTVLGVAAWFGFSTHAPGGANEPTAELARATSELQLAEQHYLNAIASLEQLTVRKDTTLDPAVAAEIAQSLKSIDRAIDDSRAALETDPSSFVAQTSLLDALRMKVALLQETVSLMNAPS